VGAKQEFLNFVAFDHFSWLRDTFPSQTSGCVEARSIIAVFRKQWGKWSQKGCSNGRNEILGKDGVPENKFVNIDANGANNATHFTEIMVMITKSAKRKILTNKQKKHGIHIQNSQK
jgi:hypothetical protein